MRRFLVLLTVLAVISPALAANFTLRTKTEKYHLVLDTDGAMCGMNQLEGGGWEAHCSDGPNEVRANTRLGCLASTGPGYCGTAKPALHPPSFNMLLCPSGKKYYLSSGIDAENSCKIDLESGWKRCESDDLQNYAEADCEHGCREAGGAGVCCIGDTDRCPFEKEEEGETDDD